MDKQEIVDRRMAKARKVRMANLANKGKKTYRNLRWMQQRYCIERLGLDEIAELCKVEYDEIWEALKELKIPIRIMSTEFEIDKYKEKLLSKL